MSTVTTRKISKTSSSYVLTIPKDWITARLREGWDNELSVEIETRGEELVIRKARSDGTSDTRKLDGKA